MEKKDNKAEYFFGSKPVLERAEDDNEFEGSLTTSTELFNLGLIHEIPSAFWRSVWIDLASQGKIQVTDQTFETGELQFVPNKNFEWHAARKLLVGDPLWKMNSESARYKGWNWDGDRYLSIWEVIGHEELKEVVSLFFVDAERLGTKVSIQSNIMMQDPVPLNNIRTWQQLWDEAAQGQHHDIVNTIKQTDGPEKVFCIRFGYRNMSRVWFAKRAKSTLWYVLWYGEY